MVSSPGPSTLTGSLTAWLPAPSRTLSRYVVPAVTTRALAAGGRQRVRGFVWSRVRQRNQHPAAIWLLSFELRARGIAFAGIGRTAISARPHEERGQTIGAGLGEDLEAVDRGRGAINDQASAARRAGPQGAAWRLPSANSSWVASRYTPSFSGAKR